MNRHKVLFALTVIVNQLARIQSEVNNTSVEATTGNEQVVTCPINNFSVEPLLIKENNYSYISLHLSWDYNISDLHLIVEPSTPSVKCAFQDTYISPNIINNTIVIPTSNTDPDLKPSCNYHITMSSHHPRCSCKYNYTIPECVEDECDCDQYSPEVKILGVQYVSGDTYLIQWDPGQTTKKNITYEIKEMDFEFENSFDPYNANKGIAKELEHGDNTTKVEMQLTNGVKYTLTGVFMNNYSCETQSHFSFTAPTKSYYKVITFCIGVFIFLLIVFWKRENIQAYLEKVVKLFKRQVQHGELEPLQHSRIPMESNRQYIPIEQLDGTFDEYEFPRNGITIQERIGYGAFGQVYSAKAKDIGGFDGFKMVAVKVLGAGEYISREATNDFAAEIEIFKKVGRHPNIVALLGCCTKDVPHMMIMEFVPCGDLKNYLVELRGEWLAKTDPTKSSEFFFPNTSDGEYIFEPQTPTTPNSITTSRLPSTSDTISTTVEDQLTPCPPSDAHVLTKILDHNELQNFALQIARGMEHLEKKSITHRDLAARNILINEYKVLKISDFGLSRSGPYTNQKTRKLPLRWMALEAITQLKYDSRSDVWSFGVVLWEIGTLGAFPYEGVLDSFLQQYLQLGKRLDRPAICTDELYSLMMRCWATDPDQRPTFQELVECLDVKKRKIYVNFDQLNPTYVFPPCEIEKCAETPVTVVDIRL